MMVRLWIMLGVAGLAGCARTPAERCQQSVETALRAGQIEEALQRVEACVQADPAALGPRRQRVVVLLRLDKLDQARAEVQSLPAADPVLRLALRRREPMVRAGAARLIAEHPRSDSYQAVVRGLGDSVADVRRHCVRALGRLRDPRALKPLYRALQDDNWHVRAEAVDALAEIGDPRCVGWLIARLKDGDGFVRFRVTVALERLATEASRETLVRALSQTREDQQLAIAITLAKLQEPAAFGPLTNATRHTDAGVRRQAVQALLVGGYAAATNSLEALANDSDEELRDWVRRTLNSSRLSGAGRNVHN